MNLWDLNSLSLLMSFAMGERWIPLCPFARRG
jgi:hypothetical protein